MNLSNILIDIPPNFSRSLGRQIDGMYVITNIKKNRSITEKKAQTI